MKVKSEFIHDVIRNVCKITPNYFYWSKLIYASDEPENEIWEVSRTVKDNVYCGYDLKFLIRDGLQIERLGLYNYHGQKY